MDVVIGPNPSSGRFWVDVREETSDFKFEVSDVSGQIVHSVVAQHSRFQVELEVETGVYILTVQSENGRSARRLVVW